MDPKILDYLKKTFQGAKDLPEGDAPNSNPDLTKPTESPYTDGTLLSSPVPPVADSVEPQLPAADPDYSKLQGPGLPAAAIGATNGVNEALNTDATSAARNPSASSASQQPAQPVDAAAPTDYGYGEGLNDDALKAAQAMQQSNQAKSNLGRAFSTAISGISNQTPDTSFFDTLDKQSAQLPANILARRAGTDAEQKHSITQESMDPQSGENAAFRAYLKANFPDLASGQNFNKITLANPAMQKFVEAYQSSKNQKLSLAQAREFKEATLQLGQARYDGLKDQRAWHNQEGATKAAFSDPEYKDALKKANAADDGLSMIEDAFTNGNAISNNAKPIELARAIAGGRINVQEMQALYGSSALKDRLEQFIQTATTGTMTKTNYDFYKQLTNTMKREAQVHMDAAIARQSQAVAGRIGGSANQAKQYILGAPSTPQTPAPAAAGSSADQQAIDWAKKNPTDPRAAKILKHNGM